MRRPLLLLTVSALMMLGVRLGLQITRDDAGARAAPAVVDPNDVFIQGTRGEDGRLFVDIIDEIGDKRCYFDAAVTLSDGRIDGIANQDSLGRAKAGAAVQGLPKGFERGSIVSIPVHFDSANGLRAGYSECVR